MAFTSVPRTNSVTHTLVGGQPQGEPAAPGVPRMEPREGFREVFKRLVLERIAQEGPLLERHRVILERMERLGFTAEELDELRERIIGPALETKPALQTKAEES